MYDARRSSAYDKIVHLLEKTESSYKSGNTTARPQVRTTMDRWIAITQEAKDGINIVEH